MTIFSDYNLPILNIFGSSATPQRTDVSSLPMFDVFSADSGTYSYVPGLPELLGGISDFSGSSIQAPAGWFNFPTLKMPDFSNMKFSFSFNPVNSGSTSGTSSSTDRSRYSGTLSQQLVQKALSYKGKVNSDAQGNRLFSPNGTSQHWCADFVTYNVRQIYGSKLPSDFGSSAVDGLKSFGEKHGCYLNVSSISGSARSGYIAKNVKPGDIMIEKNGGKSHTGIVTRVYSDGSFDTVEGNASDSVKTHHYSANSSTLSGFVTLDKYAA